MKALHPRGVFATATRVFAPAAMLGPMGAIAARIWNGRVGPGGLARRGEGKRCFHLWRLHVGNAVRGADHGVDINANGEGTVREQRLYQLIRQSGDVREHDFSIQFQDDGVTAYAFTFG